MPVRIFHVDDHELIRIGIRTVVENSPGLELVGQAATGEETLQRIPATRPDVVILDVELGDGPSGIEVCREVRSRWPHLHCLMLTAYGDDRSLFASIMAGASGYLLKGVKPDTLVDAVKAVASGRSLLDPRVTAQVLERLRTGIRTSEPALTEREQEILHLIAEGATNRQIGEKLHLAEKTIRNYVSGLLAKLGVQRRSEAAAYAARQTAVTRRPNSEM
ncbi:MAG TPA: response regulator transcription factor [Acidimicrobiia bacterium]|nr:response regulator transcription factor [Acidimicrobiia bacterium]